MKRSVLLLVLVSVLAMVFAGNAPEVSAQDAQWLLKYQILAPKQFVIEKAVTRPNPDNPDLPIVEVIKQKYWYQVMYFKNPLKEKITSPFDCVLLVDTAKVVRDPESGEEIDVSNLMPAFKGQAPNYVTNEKTGSRIPIPGTAFRPVHDPVVMSKVLEHIRIKPYRDHEFVNSYKSDLLTGSALEKYLGFVDMHTAFESEELRQVIMIYTDLAEGFDHLTFRFSGLTNEYIFASEEEKKEGKGLKKVLRLEYTRPGDEFNTDDVNPAAVDLFHIEKPEWVTEAMD